MTSVPTPASPLVDARALMAAIEQGARLVLLDASFELNDPAAGERAFADGHLPGAQYVHLERDLSGPKTELGPGFTGRHPLPARTALAATIGRLGISPEQAVVTMDRQGGPYAARAWWTLRWLGHSRVWVLDGGVDAWRAVGGKLTSEASPPRPCQPYPARRHTMPTIEVDALQDAIGRVTLLDARSRERFRGDVEPYDSAAGHIPGAVSRPFTDNLASGGACFKPRAELAAEIGALIGARRPRDVVHQCGSGVTACHNLLAMEVAGLTGSCLYPGSWSEWCADPRRPVARGGALRPT